MCSHADGHLGCFQFETERSTALNECSCTSLLVPLYKFLCAKYIDLAVELLGNRLCLCSTLLDSANLFTKVIVPVYISTSSV